MQTHFNLKISLFVYCIMLVFEFQLVNDRLESIFKKGVIAQSRHCYCVCGRSDKQNGNPTMTVSRWHSNEHFLNMSRTPKLRQPAQGTFGITLPLKYWCVYVLCKTPNQIFYISYCPHACCKSGLSCSCSMDVTTSFPIAHFNISLPFVSQWTMSALVLSYSSLIMTFKGRKS